MAIETNDREPIAPSEEELASLNDLASLLRRTDGPVRLVGPEGEEVALTEAALRALRRAASALARDRVVFVTSTTKDLGFDQVADLVDLPAAEILKLIDDGLLPATIRYGLPSVRFEDALVLKRQRDAERRQLLDQMTIEGQAIAALVGDFMPEHDTVAMETLDRRTA